MHFLSLPLFNGLFLKHSFSAQPILRTSHVDEQMQLLTDLLCLFVAHNEVVASVVMHRLTRFSLLLHPSLSMPLNCTSQVTY